MKTPHAILIGFAMIALAILFVGRSDHARAQSDDSNFDIAAGGSMGFVINNTTGDLWRCDAVSPTCMRVQLSK